MPAAPPPPFRRAVILAVGSELLGIERLDTNSLAMTAALNDCGIDLVWKAVAGDDAPSLARAVRRAIDDADLLLVCGGLGPTDDDLTRDVVADVLGRPLRHDPAIEAAIEARFAARGWVMADNNRRQAQVPEGATVLPNARGTAPGLWIDDGARGVLLLPGPPREMMPLLEQAVASFIAPRSGGRRIVRRMLRMTGRGESTIDALLQPSYRAWADGPVPVRATILASMGQIELHLSSVDADPARAQAAVDAACVTARAVIGRDVFSDDGSSLEAVVGHLLLARGWTVAVGESCTGGLVAERLTAVPGASRYFDQGVVTYSNAAKIGWLGVPEPLLAEHGAVSEPVARAMAAGVRGRTGADVGLGVTGIAGPGGGTPDKPVGTVAIAVALPPVAAGGDDADRGAGSAGVSSRVLRFSGDREQIRFQSSQAVLDLLRRTLER
ncbi:MAG: competence/damage-inducible protein A [Vicinamibacterales bacterium]